MCVLYSEAIKLSMSVPPGYRPTHNLSVGRVLRRAADISVDLCQRMRVFPYKTVSIPSASRVFTRMPYELCFVRHD